MRFFKLLREAIFTGKKMNQEQLPIKTTTNIYDNKDLPQEVRGGVSYSSGAQEQTPKILNFLTPRLKTISQTTLVYTSKVLPMTMQSKLETLLTTNPLTLAKNNLPVRVYEKLDHGVQVVGKGVCWSEDRVIDGYKKGKETFEEGKDRVCKGVEKGKAMFGKREKKEDGGFGDGSSIESVSGSEAGEKLKEVGSIGEFSMNGEKSFEE